MIDRPSKLLAAAGLLASVFTAACADDATAPPRAPLTQAPALTQNADGAAESSAVSAYLANLNRQLAASGLGLGVARAEIMRAGDANNATIVFANDRAKRLDSHWVPGDARRDADGNKITYLVYRPFARANGSIDAEPSIDHSLATWKAVTCSKLDIVKRRDTGVFPSAIFGGTPFLADIVELGFLPGSIFDLVLGPGASQSVLGVTFTFVFGDYDANGDFIPSDINRDGKDDTAIKEVWYNDAFAWTNTGTGAKIDIETVALHENGHALELGHFGKVALNLSSGKLQVSPRAVMNAFVLGTLRAPLGTDNAAYCGDWASWPNK